MTKKEFIALADAIRRYGNETDDSFNPSQISWIAKFCKTQNPAFKEGRWLDYVEGKCGKNGGAIKK